MTRMFILTKTQIQRASLDQAQHLFNRMTMIKMILGALAEPGQHQYWMLEKSETLHDPYFGLLKIISVVFLSWRQCDHLSAAFAFPSVRITSEKQSA